MNLPRSEPELAKERQEIIRQFHNCAMHHSRFLGKDELRRVEKVQLEDLATLYTPYRHTTGLAELEKTRKTIETAISILSESFAFKRIKAQSIHHSINKTSRKILTYNFAILLKN